MSDASTDRREAWLWWERRRLRYNVGLATSGWAAYVAAWLIMFALGEPMPDEPRQVLSMTLFLGTGFLAVMAAANVAYLAGVLLETMLRPRNVEAYRTRAWNLGFWGALALPFLFPLIITASTLGRP